MGCCGQGRAALRAQSATARGRTDLSRAAPSPPEQRHSPARTSSPPATTILRYLGNNPVRIRGSVTGLLYEFADGRQARVAASDAPLMVRTGLFARA
jgi:hypothetical protein